MFDVAIDLGWTRNAAARGFGLVLGTWLWLSRFVWVHSPLQLENTHIVAVVYTSLIVASIGSPSVRYAGGAVAAWLFMSVWTFPSAAQATFWNNLLVSIAMFAAATISVRAQPALGRVVSPTR
jgi:hypothetical protein